MDTQDIRTLKILEEMDQDEAPSQRHLATKLNVSLGLVNSFIKRLVKKGYFKVSTIPANRVRYILTPKGAAEKTRLTYEYVQQSFLVYRDTRRKLSKIFKRLENQEIKKVVFLGVSEIAEIAYISLQETAVELVGIVDRAHAGEKFFGFKVFTPEEVSAVNFERMLVTGAEATDSVINDILDLGIAKNRIVLLQ
ncbi:MAG: winged helix-turn-helix transcriptional regulator [Pseudomonadota bacterium]